MKGTTFAATFILIAFAAAYGLSGHHKLNRTNLADSTVFENSRAGDRSRYVAHLVFGPCALVVSCCTSEQHFDVPGTLWWKVVTAMVDSDSL